MYISMHTCIIHIDTCISYITHIHTAFYHTSVLLDTMRNNASLTDSEGQAKTVRGKTSKFLCDVDWQYHPYKQRATYHHLHFFQHDILIKIWL